MIQLYSAFICPFAQRTRALLTHLEVPFELHEIDLTDKPADFIALSPTGKVPMALDGALKLYESMVINSYCAEVRRWHTDLDPALRARRWLAMMQFDNVALGSFYRSVRDPATFTQDVSWRVGQEMTELGNTLAALDHEPGGGWLTFHCAPFWARMGWLEEFTPYPGFVRSKHPELAAWLDRAVEHPAVQATLPDRDEALAVYKRRYIGKPL